MLSDLDITKALIEEKMGQAPPLRNYGASPLKVRVGDYFYSYNTCVGVKIERKLYVPRYYSTTTSRHINSMAEDNYLEVIRLYKGEL